MSVPGPPAPWRPPGTRAPKPGRARAGKFAWSWRGARRPGSLSGQCELGPRHRAGAPGPARPGRRGWRRRSPPLDGGPGAESAGLGGRRVGRLPAATPHPGPLGELWLGVGNNAPAGGRGRQPGARLRGAMGLARAAEAPRLEPRARLGPGWGGEGSVAWRDPCVAGDGGASRESGRWGRLGGRGGEGREALGGARGAWRPSAPLSLLPPGLIPGTDAPGSRVGARLPQLFGRKLWSGVTRSSPGPGGRGRAIECVLGQNGFSQTPVRATRSPNALALPSLQPGWCAIPGRAPRGGTRAALGPGPAQRHVGAGAGWQGRHAWWGPG